MVKLTYEIINQIKAATDNSQVKIILANSVQELNVNSRNGSSRRFMMNLVMALRYAKAEGLDPKALANVSNAIDVIEQLRKQEYGKLF